MRSLAADRGSLKRDALFAPSHQLTPHLLEAECLVEALRRQVRGLDVVFTGDHRRASCPGMSEDEFVEHTTQPAAMQGDRHNNAVNVQEPLVPFDEPPVVDTVVARTLTQRENEGANLSLHLQHLMKVGLMVQLLQLLSRERAEEPLRFAIQRKYRCKVAGTSSAGRHVAFRLSDGQGGIAVKSHLRPDS